MLNDDRIGLTEYEAEVLLAYRVCKGDPDRIARKLRLHLHTVRSILDDLKLKFGAQNRDGMFYLAKEGGYID